MTQAPSAPEGIVAGRYLVRGHLGLGGMATVVAADDLETGESVALKMMHEPVEGNALDRRLLQELLSAAQVNHPNLVTVIDFGIDAGSRRPFFVMEMLHGEDLAVCVARKGACPAEWLLPLFADALDGLDAVHRRGIVHKDIKPANLFVDRRPGAPAPRLRITDFGIAHHMERARITMDGGLACTPRYTAPEYLSRSVVTPASDIYQMGLVLAEALLGWSMVAEGPFADVVFAHVRGQLRLPPGLGGSPLGQVLLCALALDPRNRYAGASEFAVAVRALDVQAAAATIEVNAAMYRRRIG
jgi:serine/threonine protein kinase